MRKRWGLAGLAAMHNLARQPCRESSPVARVEALPHKRTTARRSSDPEPFFILGRIRHPLGAGILLAAARVREVRRVNAEGAQVACLRAAVTFDSGGGSAGSAENCERTADETLVVSCGSHLLARFRFLFDEQKMGSARSFCNAQLDTPAMQTKQARSVVKSTGPADRPWEEALIRTTPKGAPGVVLRRRLSLRSPPVAKAPRHDRGP